MQELAYHVKPGNWLTARNLVKSFVVLGAMVVVVGSVLIAKRPGDLQLLGLTPPLLILLAFLWEVCAASGGTELARHGLSMVLPGRMLVEIPLPQGVDKARVVVLFGRSVGFFHGSLSLRIGSEDAPAKVVRLRAIKQRGVFFYNRSLHRNADRIVIPFTVASGGGGTVRLEVCLSPNVTEAYLKDWYQWEDTQELIVSVRTGWWLWPFAKRRVPTCRAVA